MKPVALLAAALIAAPISAAAADGGLYLGAGAGQGRIKEDATAFDSKDTSYKAFAGYRFGGLPFIDLAAEVGYTDFGNPAQTTAGQRLAYKLRGATAAGLVILPLGPVDLIGKAGAMRWSSDRDLGGATSSRTGTNGFVGAGIGFRLWKLGLRAEYEYFDVKNVDRAETVSVSAIFQF